MNEKTKELQELKAVRLRSVLGKLASERDLAIANLNAVLEAPDPLDFHKIEVYLNEICERNDKIKTLQVLFMSKPEEKTDKK